MKILLFVIMIILPNIVFSHSGRTNSAGCHNDNVHGGYHCHNTPTKPKPTVTYSWYSGGWSNCTGSCGTNKGTKSRTVYCKSSTGSKVNDFYCSGTKPSSITSCTVNVCKIDDPVELSTPSQNSSVLRGGISQLSSSFDLVSIKLKCVYTAIGFFNADLFYSDSVFKIKKLEEVKQCDKYSSKYSVLTNLLSIFSVNIGADNYRASLELNSAGDFSVIYAEKNLNNLQIKLGYNRDDWGTAWLDLDGDCQDMRSEVLDLFNLEKQNKCVVTSGLWIDPYTQFAFYDATELDIDHIVPLAYAHYHGGANWSLELKSEFYNDIENLLPVSASSNRSKGDKAPDEWMPDNVNYHCQYVDSFLYIVDKYYLDLSINERSDINNACTK